MSGEADGRREPEKARGLRSREEYAELLALADADQLIGLADAVLGGCARLEVTRAPETGSVVAVVREPVSGHRFQLADVVVSTAEVELDGNAGWSMRPGAHRQAALAQAICEAELARGGEYAPGVARLCESVALARRSAREAEWARLRTTIVEFEEVL